MLGVAEVVSYEGLAVTEQDMVDAVWYSSSIELPLDVTGRVSTIDVAPGIDALKNGATS